MNASLDEVVQSVQGGSIAWGMKSLDDSLKNPSCYSRWRAIRALVRMSDDAKERLLMTKTQSGEADRNRNTNTPRFCQLVPELASLDEQLTQEGQDFD